MSPKKSYDVAVIGGGLTGLTVAIYLAKARKSVNLFGKQRQVGGLAQTTNENGSLFNYGLRAMYEGGAALRILKELNCLPKMGYGTQSEIIGLLEGRMIKLSSDLSPEENVEWNQIMDGLNQIDTKTHNR